MEVTLLLIYSNETSCDIDVRIALRANTWWEQALGHQASKVSRTVLAEALQKMHLEMTNRK
jgi:hypothetical protein